jgi:hypothetical protein
MLRDCKEGKMDEIRIERITAIDFLNDRIKKGRVLCRWCGTEMKEIRTNEYLHPEPYEDFCDKGFILEEIIPWEEENKVRCIAAISGRCTDTSCPHARKHAPIDEYIGDCTQRRGCVYSKLDGNECRCKGEK